MWLKGKYKYVNGYKYMVWCIELWKFVRYASAVHIARGEGGGCVAANMSPPPGGSGLGDWGFWGCGSITGPHAAQRALVNYALICCVKCLFNGSDVVAKVREPCFSHFYALSVDFHKRSCSPLTENRERQDNCMPSLNRKRNCWRRPSKVCNNIAYN